MLGCQVSNQLGVRHGFARTGAAEQAHLATTWQRCNQVDHLDAGLQDRRLRLLIGVGRRSAMNRHPWRGIGDVGAGVQWLTHHVEDAAQRLRAHGDGNCRTGVFGRCAAAQPVSGVQRQTAHPVVAQVLLHLGNQPLAVHVHVHGVEQLRQIARGKFNVYHRTDDASHATRCHLCLLPSALSSVRGRPCRPRCRAVRP